MDMKKSLIAVMFILPLVTVLAFTPILVNQVFALSHIDNPILPPHQQWRLGQDINELTCKEGFVLITKANGMPACISPNSYLRLTDRGWAQSVL